MGNPSNEIFEVENRDSEMEDEEPVDAEDQAVTESGDTKPIQRHTDHRLTATQINLPNPILHHDIEANNLILFPLTLTSNRGQRGRCLGTFGNAQRYFCVFWKTWHRWPFIDAYITTTQLVRHMGPFHATWPTLLATHGRLSPQITHC